MNEIGQITQRVVARLRRRETLRIAAPVAGVIIVVGILLGVFLPGGPESDEPTGQTVDIADRATEASADGAPPADEAPADTTNAADAGDAAVTAQPGPDAAPAAATTETAETTGTTETAEGTESVGTIVTAEGAGSAGTTETAEGAGSAGTTETAEGAGSAGTTETTEGAGSAGTTETTEGAGSAGTTETAEGAGSAGTTETTEGAGSAGTTETAEGAGSAGTTETAEGAGSAGTTETTEGAGSAGTTETAEGAGSAGTTETAETAGTTQTAGTASASSSADTAAGGADAAAQQDAAAPTAKDDGAPSATAEDDGAPAATAEAGPDEDSLSSAGAGEAAVASGGDAADTAVSGDAAGDAPAEGIESASGQEMAAASAGGDAELAAAARAADDSTAAGPSVDDAGAVEGADGSDAAPERAEAPGDADAAETAPSSQATRAGAGEAAQAEDEPIVEARTLPDGTVDAAPQGATGEGPGEGPSTETEPSDAGGDGGQAASGEEPGDAVTPPSFDTVRILPSGSAMIAGRAEPGAEVTIQSGSTVIGSVTADPRGEWVLLTDEPIPPGDHELSAVETLPDGRQVESEHVLVLSVPDLAAGEIGDVQAVLVPGDGEEPGDAVTPPSFDTVRILPNGSAMIAGRAEPGAEVTIQSGSTVIGSVAADPRGEWVLLTDEPIPPGDHELSAVETLPDGRQVESEHVLVLSVPDLAAGEKAGDVQDVLVPGDGEEPGDAVTPPSFDTVRISPDGSAVIAGRAEPGAHVTVRNGSEDIGSVTADLRGEWVLLTDEPIPPGDHELSAVETLPDGRQVESEHVLVLSVPDLAAGEKAGDVQDVLVPGDGEEPGDAVTPPSFDTVRISPDGSAVIAGRAEPGAHVTVRNGSEDIGSVTADLRGEWVLLPDEPIPPGDHELSAVETLPDGRQVESEHVVVLSVPDVDAGEDAGTALAVLVPRDGEGKSTVLQQPAPAPVAEKAPEEEPIDMASLDEPGSGEASSHEAGAGTGTAAGGEVSSETPSDRAEVSPDATSDPAEASSSTEEASAALPEGVTDGSLSVGTVDYDDEGDMTIAGKAEPEAQVNVYVDEKHVGTVESNEQGEWVVDPEEEVEPGSHTLRVDQVDPAGVVLARIETPLVRARPELLTLGDAIVVVQPGNSLWRIARRTLGGGIHFTEIYEANRSQIRDPALIYPGQIFALPSRGGG